MNLGVVATIIIAVYALYRGLRDFLLNRDIGVASKKITLLDTVIEAKDLEIAKDEQKVREMSDAYDKLRAGHKPTDN